jgi:hypothetical protein
MIRYFQDSPPAGAAGQQGLAGLLLLTNRQTSRAIALLLWETEAELLAHRSDHRQWLVPVTDLLDALARSVSYEVSVWVERTEQGSLWMHGI